MSLTFGVIFGAVRAASAPAPSGTPYVAAAYIFFLLVIVVYVSIMALRLTRNQREIQRMSAELDANERAAEAATAASAEAGKQEQVA